MEKLIKMFVGYLTCDQTDVRIAEESDSYGDFLSYMLEDFDGKKVKIVVVEVDN